MSFSFIDLCLRQYKKYCYIVVMHNLVGCHFLVLASVLLLYVLMFNII